MDPYSALISSTELYDKHVPTWLPPRGSGLTQGSGFRVRISISAAQIMLIFGIYVYSGQPVEIRHASFWPHGRFFANRHATTTIGCIRHAVNRLRWVYGMPQTAIRGGPGRCHHRLAWSSSPEGCVQIDFDKSYGFNCFLYINMSTCQLGYCEVWPVVQSTSRSNQL